MLVNVKVVHKTLMNAHHHHVIQQEVIVLMESTRMSVIVIQDGPVILEAEKISF